VRVLYISFFVIVVDQLSKLFVRGISIPSLGIELTGMPLRTSKRLIGDFLRITYIENPGMAFGISFGPKALFSIIAVVASIAILWYLYLIRQEGIMPRLSLALILGGAIGNLIDRVFYGIWFQQAPLFQGKVIDFIDMDFFHINLFGHQVNRWPVFNIADASVTIGVVLLIFFHRRTGKLQEESEVKYSNASFDDPDHGTRESGETGNSSPPQP